MSSSYTSSSTSYTSTTANGGTTSSGTHQAQSQYTDSAGNTTVRSTTQNLGEPAIEESAQYDNQGRQLVGDGISSAGQGRIAGDEGLKVEDVTEQDKNDQAYLERMEDEYAKREGGA